MTWIGCSPHLGLVQGLTESCPSPQRPPVDRGSALRRGGSGRRSRPSTNSAPNRGDHLLPQRHLADHQELVPGPGRKDPEERSGGPDGVAGDSRLDSDRDLGPAVPGRDRLRVAEPLDHHGDAGRLRRDHRRGRSLRPQRPTAVAADLGPRRAVRAGPVARLIPGVSRSGPRGRPFLGYSARRRKVRVLLAIPSVFGPLLKLLPLAAPSSVLVTGIWPLWPSRRTGGDPWLLAISAPQLPAFGSPIALSAASPCSLTGVWIPCRPLSGDSASS